ncbi:putative serine protease K12H4.7 [Macrosteles quadrilineatus]|uniref:putative serine protease K12H4.7 n=1 Tax=Macrosteles quadrilineatus TaxID=74068 RepID=UPI0023E17196|nr:putative serine protease K12H4.7 [Macrosteles quadrilineatus]XP_054264800.1 putative serine protease K12H4.7 [Macrosteles quadrilineatus]
MALLLQISLLLLASITGAVLRRDRYGRLGTLTITDDKPLPPDQWFTQLLDHSDPTNNNTWQQRYQSLSDYYVTGGPVFIMLGGEGEATPVWLVKGNWVNYAKKYKALMFQLEHRFYGKSHPTSDLSVANLRYLTSEQALADAAYFIQEITVQYSLPTGTRWIVFGGSYSGNLAAWLRYKYPHLVHGAMSASGPVLAKTDFTEYMDVVTQSLSTYGENCPKAIKSANRLINKNLKNKKGKKTIFKQFRLCDTINVTNQFDIYSLLEAMADNIAGIVQYNKDNRAFRSSTWNITIDTVCDIMVNQSLGNTQARYAAVNTLLLDAYEENCLDYKYNNYIEELKNISWGGIGGYYGARQWTYQTCTEFGYYQTSENKTDLFGNDFPLNFFIQQCTDIFGKSFTKDVVDAGVYRTNTIYGGLDLSATNVVYVHGSIDPWHALGITSARDNQTTALLINGTAHCANMYPPAKTDLPALKAARKEVGVLIGKWIEQE